MKSDGTDSRLKGYDTPQARCLIDLAPAEDDVHGVNGLVGELLVTLKALVWAIELHYPRDQFSTLAHAKRLIDQAEALGAPGDGPS